MKVPQRRCANKACRTKFTPSHNGQHCCCSDCAYACIKAQNEKAREKAFTKKTTKPKPKKKERSILRPVPTDKKLSHWKELTQRAVNDARRETELANGEGCISCGTTRAAAWHAGHYRSIGTASHLRFNPININLQCDHCNTTLSGNAAAYRINLVKKYGEEVVQELDNDNAPYKWTEDELKTIRLRALADLRVLKKREAA